MASFPQTVLAGKARDKCQDAMPMLSQGVVGEGGSLLLISCSFSIVYCVVIYASIFYRSYESLQL